MSSSSCRYRAVFQEGLEGWRLRDTGVMSQGTLGVHVGHEEGWEGNTVTPPCRRQAS